MTAEAGAGFVLPDSVKGLATGGSEVLGVLVAGEGSPKVIAGEVGEATGGETTGELTGATIAVGAGSVAVGAIPTTIGSVLPAKGALRLKTMH